jgi:hypothetical protein
MDGYRSTCALCPWASPPYPTRDLAGCAATWHVFEGHRETWRSMFGGLSPRDPDPRLTRGSS